MVLAALALLAAPAGAQELHVQWSSYLGGSGEDYGWQVTRGSDETIVIVGETYSADFGIPADAYDPTYNGLSDAYMVHLSRDGSELIGATYLGTSARDVCRDAVVDEEGNIYILGHTNSPDFPLTAGAVDSTITSWPADLFIAKLDPTGRELLYSTFLGGSGEEKGRAITLLGPDRVCVVGRTESPDFPGVSDSSYDRYYSGRWDVFVSVLDLAVPEIVFSTYLGSIFDEVAWDVGADAEGCIYVTGYTESFAFPRTPNALDVILDGPEAGFLTKLNPTGRHVLYSTFLDGEDLDRGWRLAVQPDGEVFVTGFTRSADFPTTPQAHDTHLDGQEDVFLLALTPDYELRFATLLGGTGSERGQAIVLDQLGYVHVAGGTNSEDFPIAGTIPDPDTNGSRDFFLATFSPDGTELLAASYFGGRGWEEAWGLALVGPRAIAMTGLSGSDNYPTTAGAYDRTFNGELDPTIALFVVDPDYAGIAAPGDPHPAPTPHLQVVPQPASGCIEIEFALPAAGTVGLDLLDAGGRRLATLADNLHTDGAGRLRVDLARVPTRHGPLPVGLYLLHLRSPFGEVTRKVILSR